MDDIKKFKEKQINDYISSIYLNEDSIDINTIKNDLGIILKEKPGVELNYKTESLVFEDGKKSVRKERLESINVYYTYEVYENNETKIRFGKLTYIAD